MRRERKRERTRRQIFEAARALFAARGYAAVTIGEICDAADVARGTFFGHFASKPALLEEWVRGLAREVAERLRDAPGSALAEYRSVVEQLGERWPRRADLALALLPVALAAAPELCDVLEGVVRRGQQRGELRRNVPARLAAEALLATTAAALSRGPADAARSPLLNLLLHGSAEPKPRLKWSAPTARQ